MNIPVRIGMDTSKSVFQLHGVDENEVVVVRRQFRRAEMIRYFERLPPVLVAIESCGSSHHWGRLLQSFGHEVKLIPPQYVKAYVKRGKNDAADAEALCEAVTRPSMRFVPVKSKERQAACMLMTVRERLVSVKSQLSNAFRSYAAEFGIVGPAGRQNVAALIKRVLEDDSLPEMARDKPTPWLASLLERKPPKLVAVASANKFARIAWRLMISGGVYNRPVAAVPT
jgi:transposase